MPLGEDWLAAQGEDAPLLSAVHRAIHSGDPVVLGLAVSGGGDSLAMLHLAHRVGQAAGWRIEAVTVNHGLRAEAQAEAEFVARACAGISVPHTILHWHRTEVTGNLMDQASRARRRLIADWAAARGIGTVALGHTMDDQAETFVMRLARKSGVDGLSAMRRSWSEGGVTWVRPLIDCERSRLRDYLRRGGQEWIEDPSNENPMFDRARVRAAMPSLAGVGVGSHEIAHVASQLARARDALDDWTREVAGRIATCENGDVLFDRAGLAAVHPEVLRRLILRLLEWFNATDYPPRAEKVDKLALALREGQSHTLGGCLVLPSRDWLRVTREPRAVRDVTGATTALWDNRWTLDGPHEPGLVVRALGECGIRLCPGWQATGIPRQSLLASPAVWQGDTLVAAPLAGKAAGWTAQIATDFHAFLVSH